jgi:hypothetical protein
MSFERTLIRNQLKKKYGNKKIAKEWRKFRIKNFGKINYLREFNITTKSHLTPQDIY